MTIFKSGNGSFIVVETFYNTFSIDNALISIDYSFLLSEGIFFYDFFYLFIFFLSEGIFVCCLSRIGN